MTNSGYGKSGFFRRFMEAVAGAGQPALVVDPKDESVRIDRLEGQEAELFYYGPGSEAPDPEDVIGEGSPDSADESEPFSER